MSSLSMFEDGCQLFFNFFHPEGFYFEQNHRQIRSSLLTSKAFRMNLLGMGKD